MSFCFLLISVFFITFYYKVLCHLKYLCSRSRGVSAQRRAKAVGIDCAVLIILHLIRILIILYSIEMLDLRIMTILYLMEMLDLRMILETHQWTVEGSINVIHIHERVETLQIYDSVQRLHLFLKICELRDGEDKLMHHM